MAIPSNIATVFASANPGLALLLKFDFVSGTKRVYTGFGPLTTLDGQQWDGVGDVISVDGLSVAVGGAAPEGRIIASGVSAQLLATAIGEESEYERRPLSIFLQAFDGQTLIGNPLPFGLRLMTSMEVQREADRRTIAINHESIFISRNSPAASSYSDRDQQRRYPGDRGCERVPLLINKTERWPDY